MPDWMIAFWETLQDPNKLAASEFLWAILVGVIGALVIIVRWIFKKKRDDKPSPTNTASDGGVINTGTAGDITTNRGQE